MCQAQPHPIGIKSRPILVVKLSIALLLPIGLLVIVSFLAGCTVRFLCHWSSLDISQLNGAIIGGNGSAPFFHNDWFHAQTSSLTGVITAQNNNSSSSKEVMAYAQHVQVQLHLPPNHVAISFNETKWIEIMHVMERTGHNSTRFTYSHHCSTTSTKHVSCLGISLGGHIIIHILQPSDNSCTVVVMMDVLFRWDEEYHVDHHTVENYTTLQKHPTPEQQQHRIDALLETITTLFPDVPRQWSHKLRGYRESSSYLRHGNPLDQEMGVDVLRRREDKRLLVYKRTRFQNVHVYELPWRGRSSSFPATENGDRTTRMEEDRNATANHQEQQQRTPSHKDRALYLDGVLQSSLRGDAPYHEGLVHPGMLSHSNPQRVAIIGGGEGATLREVLKHRTVKHVVMLEIDEGLMGVAREVLGEWSDCSDIRMIREEEEEDETESDKSCFDDERVDVHFVDAFQWFIDHYYHHQEEEANHGILPMTNTTTTTTSENELFDVIIMDALDPDDFVDFADKLYNNTPFIQSLYNALSPDGVFVVQLGASPDIVDPSDENGPFKNRANMISKLEYLGFQSIHVYEEGHCHFYHPWSILVAFKTYATRGNWYRNAAELQIQIHRRVWGTKSGRPALSHVDAATMYSYQIPPKSFESVYCRQENEPEECEEYNGFWPDVVDVPITEVRVQKSGVSESAGRGVFAVKDIPRDATIALEEGTRAFHVAPSTWKVLDAVYEWSDENDFGGIEDKLSAMKYFIEGYGYACQLMGETHHTIDSGLMTFSNHGCNGSYNYGDEFHELTEGTMDLSLEEIPEDHDCTAKPYSPIQERHLRQILSAGDVALREIKAGEEILVNYVMFANPDEWADEVRRLRDQCAGSAVGEVSEYESRVFDGN
ncbi:hypothetical protein HJC23_011357 [Cyclotella cryptica]|uniref:SET domain-containing protein n=1 Tax=Cyclotella cryptica TaxID=29204 RepID=A0ABD3QVJ4_9STRA|eukprot:CCRYP_001784-RA/>CCRYP_001784-RA protein AED:0.07 eAED:0.07 QI:102/1/1/1/1/1/3/271/881